jgi:hypothetical protein
MRLASLTLSGERANRPGGVDLTFATPWPRVLKAIVKSKTPLETYIS